MTMLADQVDVVIGIDTHKHTHTAAVVTAVTGAALETVTVRTDVNGYQQLVELADRHGDARVWAIEGTGTYGAGLTRHLHARGERVLELDRPKRPPRRNGAKTDALDAVRTARDALAIEHNATPRDSGDRAALSVLIVARRSAVDAAKVAHMQLHALICAAPETIRQRFREQSGRGIITTAAKLRISSRWDTETQTYAGVLRDLARRHHALKTEAKTHEGAITAIITAWRPDLLAQFGVGPISAATVLCAWSHPGRCRNEAAFAKLAGVAPIPASSGLTDKHRLSRFGDRQLNRALHIVVMHRLRYDSVTQAFAERRRAEQKSDRAIKRCLKRYVARQLFRQLENPVDDQ
jgi:transposase